MHITLRKAPALAALAFVFGTASAFAADVNVTLTGDQEVPPVQTEARGTGTITIADDGAVSGTIRTTGIEGIAAHIHQAPEGKNGPPIITLTKGGDGEWSVPEGSKLTDEQMKEFEAGNLYVNVHSAAHKGGEIRGQLKP